MKALYLLSLLDQTTYLENEYILSYRMVIGRYSATEYRGLCNLPAERLQLSYFL